MLDHRVFHSVLAGSNRIVVMVNSMESVDITLKRIQPVLRRFKLKSRIFESSNRRNLLVFCD
ncbi:hypothetical protein T10_8207 [Trichinella papuae]|uniref:Uncharacterized protein n=1 Tax=Trichinella papuae TaxID=268474 RepID=A0A0V1M009_9BILA|nr:hypothetical protein T10_8207 [Trichinella papuae]